MNNNTIDQRVARQQQLSTGESRSVEMSCNAFARFRENFSESARNASDISKIGVVAVLGNTAAGAAMGGGIADAFTTSVMAGVFPVLPPALSGAAFALGTSSIGLAALTAVVIGVSALAKTMRNNQAAMRQSVEAASATNQERDQQSAGMHAPAPH